MSREKAEGKRENQRIYARKQPFSQSITEQVAPVVAFAAASLKSPQPPATASTKAMVNTPLLNCSKVGILERARRHRVDDEPGDDGRGPDGEETAATIKPPGKCGGRAHAGR